jgi:hypothetical protein
VMIYKDDPLIIFRTPIPTMLFRARVKEVIEIKYCLPK